MNTLRKMSLIAVLALTGAFAARADEKAMVNTDVKDTIDLFKKTDAKMESLFNTAYGYAVFPTVAKGAVGIGAAEGSGQVFEKENLIGLAKLTQVTAGAQLGGQEYSEVIFFETEKALNEFKEQKLEMSAGVSAVAAADGAAANAKYSRGVLIFTVAKQGLMFEASVGGQKFKFTPIATK